MLVRIPGCARARARNWMRKIRIDNRARSAGLGAFDPVPWTSGLSGVDTLTVFPRTAVTADTVRDVAAAVVPGHKALLLPADVPATASDIPVTVLRCPDRLADIDKSIEDRLLKSRISRG